MNGHDLKITAYTRTGNHDILYNAVVLSGVPRPSGAQDHRKIWHPYDQIIYLFSLKVCCSKICLS